MRRNPEVPRRCAAPQEQKPQKSSGAGARSQEAVCAESRIQQEILDVSAKSRVVVTGDNMGHVILLDTDGKELWNLRMHKKKVAYMALNPCCDWLLATASIDQTVKIWDLRQNKGKTSFLYSLPHRHPVNAACFSLDGARLLTTDQNNEIQVYSASQWDSPPEPDLPPASSFSAPYTHQGILASEAQPHRCGLIPRP
ncbi:DNA damage-binding protein 2 [Microtus ochrogaster]|uniref:DNA damage-binding protein 2 n=1 Tax=Microtus ochrogaster TaxID=79684 RepID=A0A8J6GRI6_MICOH|nr:DNA damage-binding protein 2 [Microtus ochrogaster]